MEEALEILWTYARREPLDSNGETVVPTINNSIAAIRIIMRLEGWAMGSEKRKVKPSENLELGYVGKKQTTHNKPTRNCSSRAGERFTQCNIGNNNSCCRELVARTDDSVCNSLIGAEGSTLGRHELKSLNTWKRVCDSRQRGICTILQDAMNCVSTENYVH